MISVQHLEQDCVHPITPRLRYSLPNGRRSLPRANHWLRADVRRMAKDGLRCALAAEEHDGVAVSAARLHPVPSVYLRPHASSGHREGIAALQPPQLAALKVAPRGAPLERHIFASVVAPRTPARCKILIDLSRRVNGKPSASPSALRSCQSSLSRVWSARRKSLRSGSRL